MRLSGPRSKPDTSLPENLVVLGIDPRTSGSYYIQHILFSVSSYCNTLIAVGTVVYFFIVVYSFYCDLKGVKSDNTPNASERPAATVLPPGGNKYVEAPFLQPPPIVTPQAPIYESDIAADSAGRRDRTDTYYSIPEGK
jgi:hypothetical protein